MKKLLSIIVLVALVFPSLAYAEEIDFNYQETISSNVFTVGSVDLRLLSDYGLADLNSLTGASLTPGDSVSDFIAMENQGTIDIDQINLTAIQTSGSEELFNKLKMRIYEVSWPSGWPNFVRGSQLIETNLSSLGNYVLWNSSLFANGGQGAREIEIYLPADTDDAYQNLTTAWQFSFTAYQDIASLFIDQVEVEQNSFSTRWWTPPESYVDLGMSQTFHQFAIDYNVEGTGESDVRQVSLYYYHTFDEDSWRFFGTDIPDDSGDGFFDFTSPFGDGIYHFKTESEDELGNKEEKFFPDALCQVDTQKPITMLSLGEFGVSRFASQEILSNGNFEDTGDPDFGWTVGGDGDHQVVSDLSIVRDTNSFLIGFKDTDLSALASLPARDFIFQDIDLPSVGSSTLSFWYRLNTEDILSYDWFKALVLDPLDNSVLASLAHDGLDFFRDDLTDFDWKEVTHSLADFIGQTVRLYFEIENTGDNEYQSWSYLDDIRITQGGNFVDTETEIVLSATDASGSGVLMTEYKIAVDDDDGEWEEYIEPFVLEGDEQELSYRSTDLNDFVEDEKTIPLIVYPNEFFLGIVLNQISPRPSGSDKGSSGVPLDGEWVELWNNNSNPIDVNGWIVYDADDHALPISVSKADNNGDINDGGETIIPAGGALRVYRNNDSDFTLNDIGDTVKLYIGYLGSGGFLIDSFSYGSTTADDKLWKRTPDGTGTWADPESLPEVSFDFRQDKKTVWFEAVNITTFDFLKYEIIYQSGESEQAIVGEIEIDGQNQVDRQDLVLGTCSSLGRVCVYDQEVSKVRLKIIFTKTDGSDFEIEKEIVY